MGRIITTTRLQDIAAARAADPEALGPILAELVIDGNVPIEAVSGLLSVSEPTIYRWMYGHSRPRDIDKIAKIKKLLTVLRKAKRGRDLPLSGTTKERIRATGQLVGKYRPPHPRMTTSVKPTTKKKLSARWGTQYECA